jgi:glutamate-ammonia-ligase adenylyltransferase
LRHLEALTRGVSRRASIQRTLLPVMLEWFADAADPDAGLLGFRQVSDSLGATPWYLRVLRDEGATAERLARLLATSRYVGDLLGRAPEAVALLGHDDDLRPRRGAALTGELVAAVRRNDDWENAVAVARGLRRRELLRVACSDLLGLLDVSEVGAALSDGAAATLEAALVTATRKVEAERRSPLPVRLAVIGMGRLGGGEQGYGSDADVMFVYEPADGDADSPRHTQAAHDVANELRRLLALPAPDPPLVVDADLRPEGKQGPLVRSLSSYAEYYRRWASVWESQALLRARPVAGDSGLGVAFTALVDGLRYPPEGLDPSAVREIRRLKSRMEVERLPRGSDPTLHTKLGRGGLSDVEWTVQLIQLRAAGRHPELRTTGTLPALAAARDLGLLSPDDAQVLTDAWQLATRVRNAIMLALGRPADAVPTDPRSLASVAGALGYRAGSRQQLVEDYRRAARRARAVYERVFFDEPAR